MSETTHSKTLDGKYSPGLTTTNPVMLFSAILEFGKTCLANVGGADMFAQLM